MSVDRSAGHDPDGSRILVVGSANLDHLAEVDALPGAGETVIGRNVRLACGGKGANQAVAAARLGARVSFVGAVGRDDAGARLRRGLREAGVDDSLVRVVDEPTGAAIISVTPDGGNSILVLPGANDLLTAQAVEAAGALGDVGTVVVQMEVPDAAINAAAALAARTGARLVVNLAPYRPLPTEVLATLLAAADPLVVNEPEAIALTTAAGGDVRQLAVAVARHARSAVVTIGERGAMCVRDATVTHVAAPSVSTVDTTGAGDAFVGALAVGLERGLDLVAAANVAVRVAAFSVTRHGAQPSYPTLDELESVRNTTESRSNRFS